METDNITISNPSGIKFLLRAFSYRNYRLFFCGQLVSLIGTWMQMIGVIWLVYKLTGSAFLLGLVGFIGQIPTLIFSPVGGVLADHLDRRKILLITQILSMVQALILAVLTLTGHAAVWHIIILSAVLGIINAFDAPVRQAFVTDMVHKKDDLGNAIALNSSMFNAARIIGPSIAGIIIAAFGEGICFMLNALSFLAVIIALWLMKTKIKAVPFDNKDMLSKLKEGFLYITRHAEIRRILLLVSLFSAIGMSYVVLMPVIVKEVLGQNASALGFLMGAGGLGALFATTYLAYRKNTAGLKNLIPAAGVIFGLCLVFFSMSRILIVSLILMVGAGFGMMAQMAASNTLIQSLTDDDKRGRVMSFFVVAFLGVSPFGNLLAGILAQRIGATGTLFLNGMLCILGVFFFRKGIPGMKHDAARRR